MVDCLQIVDIFEFSWLKGSLTESKQL